MFRVSLPITMADDRRALQAAVRGCAMPQEEARMVFIRDTLTLNRFYASPSLRAAVEAHPRLTLAGEIPLDFDRSGVMISPWRLPA
jgi:hypothetical protein